MIRAANILGKYFESKVIVAMILFAAPAFLLVQARPAGAAPAKRPVANASVPQQPEPQPQATAQPQAELTPRPPMPLR